MSERGRTSVVGADHCAKKFLPTPLDFVGVADRDRKRQLPSLEVLDRLCEGTSARSLAGWTWCLPLSPENTRVPIEGKSFTNRSNHVHPEVIMSAAAAGSGWKCSRCTFYHHAPGSRCAMCNELRVSRQQMRDFVIGKPIPNDDAVSPRAKSYTDHPQACSQSLRSHLSQQQTILSTLRPKSASSRAIANPYAKPLAVSQQQQSESVNKTPSSPIQPHVPSESLPLPQHTVTNRTTSSTSSAAGIGNKLHRSATSDGDSNPSDTGRGKNPFIALKPRPVLEYKPGPVPIDESTAHEWVYPTAETFPKRQYQLEITETALFHNTLVSLPTGLGKTLIAAAVLYNYYRWFPTGKVIFLAPTLPLVNQQVKACYDIMGIPPSDTAVLTGKVHAARREIVWRDRRVFFCTPQTVQKDLDANRCDSSKVVCVVLDEAHKSTGDYAYVKVVERLEEAGAHFRVLALSATPGTNIKAIQSVVDVLRINKIEARRDSDPSVARYIHEKQSEIVVVKQASASRTIERALNDVVGPLLERLRSAGALGRLTGNATITAYNLIRAREEFCKRQNDDGLIGFFLAAQQFVQIRSDLHKHGVGLVRSKLSRLRTERQRGMGASIVKGKEFQALWEEVAKSTCDPNSNHNNVQDKLVNNPKLTQLREILVEHFERARACSTSSRAIVFSQFRDSVSEIVDILSASRPLIRPRHFVGQGKGTKGEGGIQLKGMRQVEQQQAIREFREDTFNVLVCTCIGEEGLDIGEVDLIVNFDTLRSPIRMIQRTGRTGRKRDGRVVCLVAEGPEERTLLASRQSERNLAHALKNPKSFRVAQTMPLFPSQPKLREQNMLVSKDFHISQVEGHEGTRRKVLGPFDARNSQSAQEKIRWRLVTKEENERESALGRILVSKGCSEVWRTSLRRRFLLARSLSNISDTRRLNYTTGRTVRILADLRYSHGVNVSHNYSKTHSRGHGWTLEHLFPLKFDSLIGKGLHGEILPVINQSLPKNLLVELDVLNKGSMETIFRNDHGCVGRNSILGQKGFVRNKKTRETNTEHSEGEHYLTKEQTEAFGIDAPPHEARRNCRRRIQQEEAKKRPLSSSGVDILGQESMMSKFDLASTANDKENEPHCAWTGSTTVETSIVDEFILPTADQDYDTDERAQDEFVLPPTEDLSSSSDEEESRPAYESVIPRTAVAHNTGSFAGASYFPMSEHETTTVDSNQFYYRLPTQSDSSSDEDDETAMASRYVVNSQSKTASKQVAVSSSIRDKQRSSTGLRSMARFGLETSSECSFDDLVTTDSIRDASVIESPDSQAKTKATTRRAIEDTPESTISPRVSLAEPLQGKNELTNDVDGLLDTQDDVVSGVSDIVCAVCFSGESVDDDPIVLCDGRGKGETCNLAVHATCYSIPISCLGDAEWFCDLCRFPTNPSQPAPSCSHCHQEGGSLRRMPSFEWSHPLCPMNQNSEARRAGFKRLRKIPKRKSLPLDLSSQIDMYHADDNTNVPKRKLRQYRCFLDEEAGIDSDEDIDGDRMEDEELDAIEDEEAAMSSFINDSSQLGQTQDELDLADPPAPEDCVHRQLDLDRERKTVFSTPLLNRRMKRRKGRDSWTPTPASAPDSEKGLGNMHFIRSVIEHHRRGGDSEAIEQLYRMEEDQSVDESGALDCEQTLRPRIVHYCNSDSD